MYSDGFIITNIIISQNFTKGKDDFSGCLFKILPPYKSLI